MEPHNPREDHPYEMLDSLLREADWPSTDLQTLARLRKHWRKLSPARQRAPRMRFRPSAAFAAVLACIAAGALLWHTSQPDRVPQLAAPVPSPGPKLAPAEEARSVSSGQFIREMQNVESTATGTPEPPHLTNPPSERFSVATVREPNAYESLVFLAAQRRKPAARQEQIDQWVTETIGKLVADPMADLSKVAAPLLMVRPTAEVRMVAMARQLHGEEQVAAIRLLAIVGTRHSVPTLLKLRERPTTHDAAIRSLAVLADSTLLGKLVAAEQNPVLRLELLTALLKRGDAPSVAVFLSFVEKDTRTPAASAMAADIPPQAIQLLLDFLQGPQPSQRMAAACVLGQIDDQRVAHRLIHMVQENVYRQEALVALFSSPRHEASEFLALARRDPLLMASVHAAHYQFSNLP